MNVRLIQLVIGLACTLIFLAIAFDRVQLGAVSAALAGAQPVWIGAAMLSYAVNLALRAWRSTKPSRSNRCKASRTGP